GIDPASKAIVFSDGLDVERAMKIHRFCRGKVKDSYGIGTNLTNDVGVDPLNIVIKLSWVQPEPGMEGRPTVKLSDDPGKHTGDPGELLHCRKSLGL
ncbi:MAG: nicotinate phosphoribosyltransferase, partial [Desulfobacter sp.]|nr:nicotinate phosphoribosyltransferase [Desulfobacter sp.]